MNSPHFFAAMLFGVLSVTISWRHPRYTCWPCSILFIIALLQLYGLTNLMPRATELPATLGTEARIAFSHRRDLTDVASMAFYEGKHALADRQRTAMPAIVLSLIGMAATQIIVSLKYPRSAGAGAPPES